MDNTTENLNLVNEIQKLKKRKDAVILAHNYQRPEVQDIADYVGDSLELSMRATKTAAKTIVFCGVTFMAETAAILNPDRKVLIPDKNALCPLAGMLPAELIQMYRRSHPDAEAVVYINTFARAKAECDAVCTSSNAAEIINRMNSDTVLFGPDANLSRHAAQSSQKRLVTIPTSGFCPVHKLFSKEAILKLKKSHPQAKVMAHPECDPEVCSVSDFVGSTSKMCSYAKESPAKQFIVATEMGLLHKLTRERPDASFIPAYEQPVCVNMKLNTLEKIYLSLKNEQYVVKVPPEIAERARKAIEFMLQ